MKVKLKFITMESVGREITGQLSSAIKAIIKFK